jgi:NifB/MoaA-like Fe-S oxidoreductase
VSAVPVGLTRYRDGLYKLKPYTKETAAEVIRQVSAHQKRLYEKIGTRLIYLSDEFYIKAGLPMPEPDSYEGFPQLENGVGLVSSLKEEFDEAIKLVKKKEYKRKSVMIATGEITGDFISSLAKRVEEVSGINVRVYPIKNNFFGGEVNVSGLVVGSDIIEQLKDKPKADIILIPHTMLRDEDEIFLDDTTVAQVEAELGMHLEPVLNDGYEFIEKIIGEELEF